MSSAFSPLVSTEWLAAHLGDSDLRVFDTTVHLRPATPGPYTIESGRADYAREHVPGAGFLDLTDALSDPNAGLNFTNPKPDQLERELGAAGIGEGARVVLYATTTPMWATRVWWMLRAAGFDAAAVLDGGFGKWKTEGRAVSSEPCRYPPARFRARPRPQRWADRDEVLASIGSGSVCTINALSRSVHTGESETSYGRKGHIEGSVNVPFASLVNRDGTYRAPAELRAGFDAVGAFGRSRVICYCGGGISATMDAFALSLLGHPDVAVYDGSLSEWARDPSLPMKTGD
jgi:thiosulfate/3-mercaptopyruvate sulfurtransferase